MRRVAVLSLLLVAALAASAPQAAAARPRVQHLKFRFGPLSIAPGQNTISFDGDRIPRPKVSGWIVGFRPNLERTDGSVPGVDVIHLHHAVWIINGLPTFAAGEEKSNITLPRGFGWRFRRSDKWVLNHMIHNLLPDRDRVYLTYELDFIPDSSPLAKGMHEVQTRWLDVENGRAYPVFDVHRHSGRDGRFTYPDEAPDPYGGSPPRNRWNVDRDGVLVQTVGHLHPGGLYSDLVLERNGRRVNLFRSRAHYWEPAGAVIQGTGAMNATRPDWRVRAVKARGRGHVPATYDLDRASRYESMGIMPVACRARRPRRPRSPSRQARPPRARSHARAPARERQPRRRRRRPPRRQDVARRPCRDPGLWPSAVSYGLGDLQADATSGAPGGGALGSRWRSSTATPDARSSTPSPPAEHPATARRASPTRWPTAPSSSTRASSASAPRARTPAANHDKVDAGEPRQAPTTTSAGSNLHARGVPGRQLI